MDRYFDPPQPPFLNSNRYAQTFPDNNRDLYSHRFNRNHHQQQQEQHQYHNISNRSNPYIPSSHYNPLPISLQNEPTRTRLQTLLFDPPPPSIPHHLSSLNVHRDRLPHLRGEPSTPINFVPEIDRRVLPYTHQTIRFPLPETRNLDPIYARKRFRADPDGVDYHPLPVVPQSNRFRAEPAGIDHHPLPIVPQSNRFRPDPDGIAHHPLPILPQPERFRLAPDRIDRHPLPIAPQSVSFSIQETPNPSSIVRKRLGPDPGSLTFNLPTTRLDDHVGRWSSSLVHQSHRDRNYNHNDNHHRQEQRNSSHRKHLQFNASPSSSLADKKVVPDRSSSEQVSSRGKGSFNASSSMTQSPSSGSVIPHSTIKTDKGLVRDGVLRVVSGKRFPMILKTGKGKKGAGHGSMQESLQIPKKRLQKGSAFSRIQSVKPPWKRNDEHLASSSHIVDSNTSSPKSEVPNAFSKGESSVELDVSFKSNALVAKPVLPPTSVFDRLGTGLTKNKGKMRKKITFPVSCSDSLHLTRVHGGAVINDTSTSHKGLEQPGSIDLEKKTTSAIGAVECLQACQSEVVLSLGECELESLPLTGAQGGHVIDDTSASHMELKQRRSVDLEKKTTSNTGAVECWQACQNEVTPALEGSELDRYGRSMVSIKVGIRENVRKDDVISGDESVGVLDRVMTPWSDIRGAQQMSMSNGTMSDHHQDSHEYGITQRKAERGDQIEHAAEADNGYIVREKCADAAAMPSQPQKKFASLALEAETQDLERISPCKATEDGDSSSLAKEELHQSNDILEGAVDPLVSTTIYHEEGIAHSPDRLPKMAAPASISAVLDMDIPNAKKSFCHLSDEKGCGVNQVPDEKPAGKEDVNATDSLASEPEINEKSEQNMTSGYVSPVKMLLVTSDGTKQSTAKPSVTAREIVDAKNHHKSGIPRSFPRRASFTSSSSKEMASSTHNVRARTWRRTDGSSPSPSPIHESCLSSTTLKRQLPKKLAKLQSAAYIRRGNSLVRKSAPGTMPVQGLQGLGPSLHQSNSVSGTEIKNSTTTECKLESVDRLVYPKAGGANGSFERPKTPPLHRTAKLPTSAADSLYSLLAEPPLLAASETTVPGASGPSKPKEGKIADIVVSENPPTDLPIKKLEVQSMLDDEKSKNLETNGMVYVKCKSNQLVAATRPATYDSTAAITEKTQVLPVIGSHNSYYKRKKNQLIRNISLSRSQCEQATDPSDSSNSEGQKATKISSLKCSKSVSKRRLHKALEKKSKLSRFSRVWTLGGTQPNNDDRTLLQRGNVLPHIFPWRRTTYRRYFMNNKVSVSNNGSLSLISRKLQLSRKMDTVYTRSTSGFSLRKSKVVSIGGSNLKWSKSIERRSKKASEEATLAVAAVERKKREQKGASCSITSVKNGSRAPFKSFRGIDLLPGERIFRICSVRYKMDASNRTLLRIPDNKSSGVADVQSGKDTQTSLVPRRLLIGNDEYVRIGNGNQLVRNPKKLVRILASEKVQRSLHTARLRLAKKQQYCQFFTRFGKCNKDNGKCPYIHDASKVAVCTKFLKGSCSNTNCKLTHKVIPERMQDCSYFLQGLCTNESCPYRHVKVNSDASACESFLRGYCPEGNECLKKHTYVCPLFETKGTCPRGSSCKLQHPKNAHRSRKRKRSKDQKNTRDRYFGSSSLIGIGQLAAAPSDHDGAGQSRSDIFFCEGRFTDYISLDLDEGKSDEDMAPAVTQSILCNSDPSDLQSDDLDELIKPVRLMNKTKHDESSPVISM